MRWRQGWVGRGALLISLTLNNPSSVSSLKQRDSRAGMGDSGETCQLSTHTYICWFPLCLNIVVETLIPLWRHLHWAGRHMSLPYHISPHLRQTEDRAEKQTLGMTYIKRSELRQTGSTRLSIYSNEGIALTGRDIMA